MAKQRVGSAVIEFSGDDSRLKATYDKIKGDNRTLSSSFTSLGSTMDDMLGTKLQQKAHIASTSIKLIGGATKLTDAEARQHLVTLNAWIAKARALGQEVPADILKTRDALIRTNTELGKAPSMFGSMTSGLKGLIAPMAAAFSIGSVTAWVSSTLAAAGQIDDLSKKLGVSTESVQRWKFAAEQGGATIEQVDKAVTAMNRRLAEGEDSTIEALTRTGLSFDQIRKMKPEDAFNAITKAISEIEDPMVRTRVAMELFGKGGAELLPAIVDGFGKVAASASVMSDETVKRLADAEDTWARVINNIKIWSAEGLAATMRTFSNPPGEDKYLQRWLDAFNLDTKQAKQDFENLADWLDVLRGKVDTMPAIKAPRIAIGAPIAKIRMTPDEIKAMEADLNAERKALDEGSKAADKKAEAIRNLADSYTGLTAIREAQKAVAAVNLALKQGHPISEMTVEDQKKINTVVGEAIDVYRRQGEIAPESMRLIWLATQQGIPVVRGLGSELDTLGRKVPAALLALRDIPNVTTGLSVLPGTVVNLNKALDLSAIKAGNVSDSFRFFGISTRSDLLATANAAIAHYKTIKDSGQATSEAGIKAFEDMKVKMIAAGLKVSASWKDDLGALGSSLTEVGQLLPGMSGELVSMSGAGVSGFNRMTVSAKQFGTSVTASMASVLDMSIAVISTARSIVAFLERDNLAGKTVREFERASGGARQLAADAALAGISLEHLYDTDSAAAFARESERVTDAINDQREALRRYDLSWTDFNATVGQSQVDQIARTLIKDFKALTASGANPERVIKGMSGALNQLIVDAVRTGTRIPIALRPMIEAMIRAGQVTDEAARAMLGLEADTMPSLADITAAAERYGLTLDSLGPKVQQLRINEEAKQIVADYKLLIAAGADYTVVLAGMRPKIQELVNAALTAGVQIPEGMRPILQTMIDLGLLTDENGNKLENLDDINFGRDLVGAIDDLIAKLGDLIDSFSDVGTTAEDAWRRAKPPDGWFTGGIAVPKPGPGAPPATPGPEPSPGPDYGLPGARPGSHAARGGMVTRYGVQHLALGGFINPWGPRGTDTVPAWLTPGEGVLNRNAMSVIGADNLSALNGGYFKTPAITTTPASDKVVQPLTVNNSFDGAVFDSKERADYVIEEMVFKFSEVLDRGGAPRTVFGRQVRRMAMEPA